MFNNAAENGAGYHDIGRTAAQNPISLSGYTAAPTRAPYVPVAEVESANTVSAMDPFYDGCGVSKTCFGSPNGCLSKKNCRSISAVTVRGDIYEFEMKSGYSKSSNSNENLFCFYLY